jgi:DNA replication protein DnaC
MEENNSLNNSSLSPTELQSLLAVIKANKEARLKAGAVDTPKKVDSAEYLRRMAADQAKDAYLLTTVRKKKASVAASEWAEKVGPTFRHAETQTPQILERVERHRKKKGLHKTSILFYGDQLGRGKTWAAYSYINALVKEGIILPGQVFFGTESATVSRIANSGFNRNEEMLEMKRESHKIFFIDDVGQAYFFKKEHREEVWYELIDHIYTKRLTLILTTNLPFTEHGLGNWVGGRAWDRLRTLVGNDGAIKIQGINKRDAIFQENEEAYHSEKRRK